MTRFWPIALLLITTPLAAAVPKQSDFAFLQEIEIERRQPIQALAVPDAVYANVLNADLSDLRVFSQEGGVVPHALCATPASTAVEPVLETLTPFPLRAGATPVTGKGGRIELKTASGTELLVTESGEGSPPAPVVASAYILDLRALEQPVRAIQLNWQSADDASEATVSISASKDLAQWQVLMPSATLLKAESGDEILQRVRIPLPERAYQFLRIERGAQGPLPRIDSAVIERIKAPNPTPVSWLALEAQPPSNKEVAPAFWFDTARVAPMHSAEVRLPAANMALTVKLQSRNSHDQGWQLRWSGEVFALSTELEQRDQTVVQFESTQDRYWRLEVLRGAETLNNLSPSLRLGYRPARLLFLTQGKGPYVLAYGSARLEPQRPTSCDSLLATLPADDRTDLTGEAKAGQLLASGNTEALKPLPKPTPLRQMLLWGALIAGALLVVAMALGLLRKLRQE